jgi:hypothetical protein
MDRSLKSLSGGERSFCLVSLILSLWAVMTPPFRSVSALLYVACLSVSVSDPDSHGPVFNLTPRLGSGVFNFYTNLLMCFFEDKGMHSPSQLSKDDKMSIHSLLCHQNCVTERLGSGSAWIRIRLAP